MKRYEVSVTEIQHVKIKQFVYADNEDEAIDKAKTRSDKGEIDDDMELDGCETVDYLDWKAEEIEPEFEKD